MAIINEHQPSTEIAAAPSNNAGLAPNGVTVGSAPANGNGSNAAMPALASVANIAATMAPVNAAPAHAPPAAPEPASEDKDVNTLTQDDGGGSQSPTSPRKPRRTLRKTTSTTTVVEKGKAKEKDDQTDDKKWVKSTILNLKDRVDDIETMHLSLAEAVRVDQDESRTEFQSVYRTMQESQVGDLTNLARDPVIISILNTLQTLQNSVRDSNDAIRENRSAFNEMAALVATCQTRDDAMNTMASLQANIEELRATVAMPASQPAVSPGAAHTLAPLPSPSTIPPPMATWALPPVVGAQPGPITPMGGAPLSIPPVHSTPPLVRPTIPVVSPGASFNPPLSIARGKRAAEKLAERGSPKKMRQEPTVLVLVGYTEASGHPTSVAQSIIRVLNLSAHELVMANWKKNSKGFVEMYFRSVQAAHTFAKSLNAKNGGVIPELYGLSAEIIDNGDHFPTMGMGQPGPSNPGPSTR
ncbi:hypothetical protein AAF712_013018 [Marasmius tenuissimus]|uniref:RRM domain-containing protein n=1 Tax=Marasmius tenuissimus TaxID=585030 RepID=A0ABR2ZEW8_9AGAR